MDALINEDLFGLVRQFRQLSSSDLQCRSIVLGRGFCYRSLEVDELGDLLRYCRAEVFGHPEKATSFSAVEVRLGAFPRRSGVIAGPLPTVRLETYHFYEVLDGVRRPSDTRQEAADTPDTPPLHLKCQDYSNSSPCPTAAISFQRTSPDGYTNIGSSNRRVPEVPATPIG